MEVCRECCNRTQQQASSYSSSFSIPIPIPTTRRVFLNLETLCLEYKVESGVGSKSGPGCSTVCLLLNSC